jgi:regulator of sirC expression with transglutaminase-like and TPR domain
MHEARLARAVILWRELDRLEDALRDLDALLEEDATYATALLNRALIYQQTGKYGQALSDLQQYLALPADGEYRDLAERLEPLLRELAQADEGQS